ncbi:hypothetical protein NQ042_03675 [Corynebacterium phoceense]|nr:hypothetical protein [Corynebacterium phoceense]MCQ9333203.1 hypothetical protein [Corynebacterium phoceense]
MVELATAATHTSVLATALAGMKLGQPNSAYYKALRKPSWMPPK